ncbi:signal transducing kinase of the PAK [Basidiobolus ranarum]|uniref:Signal transducing kinase of the PAK n=1 Tax=Basidiobolus ranarum TaxID=34480 RepID=A0ABR2VUL6_9FUNG
MLSDKGIFSRTSSKAESLEGQLPRKHPRASTNEASYGQSLYLDNKPSNLKSTFTTLLKSVTGYFKPTSTNVNKRIRISGPSNCIHFGHAGIDSETGEFNSFANTFNEHIPGDNLEAIMSIPTQQPLNKPSFTSPKIQSVKSMEVEREKISAPLNPIHITHVSISTAGEYIGLPKDWQVALKESSLRY